MKRSISLLAILMVASLVTGCFGFLGFGADTYSVEVTWNEEMGNVVLPDNLDKIKDGTKITLKAAPKDGYEFVAWRGEGVPEGSTDLELEIVVEADLEIEAIFKEEGALDPVSVKVNWDDKMGNVELPDNLNQVTPGTTIKLKAEPKNGYEFVEWKGDASGTNLELEIVVEEDMEIEAVFKEIYDPELVKNGSFDDGQEHWETHNIWGNEHSIAIDEEKFLTGSQSLFVSERKDTGNGPRQFIDGLEGGQTYDVSFTILYEEGPDERHFFLSLETDGDGIKNLAGSWGGPDSAKKGEWTTISNTVTLGKYDEEIEDERDVVLGDNPFIFIETTWVSEPTQENDWMDFWVDNVSITIAD